MTEVQVAEAHALHLMLVNVVSLSKRGFVAMGKILRELREKDKFQMAIGNGIDTWEEYLRQPEIGLSAGEANRLIQIYEEMVLRLGYSEETVANIPVKNAYYLLPLVKEMETKEEADELVADATLLSQKDFRDRLWDRKVENEGAFIKNFEYLLMRKTVETGTMERVHGITSEVIRETFNLETSSSQ